MRYAPPHVPPSAGGTELARRKLHRCPIFPMSMNRNVCQMDTIPGGPLFRGCLPADQANPNSVVPTLQRISRSRKRVTVLRQKHVQVVKANLCAKPSGQRYMACGTPQDRGERSGTVSLQGIVRPGQERYGHGPGLTA